MAEDNNEFRPIAVSGDFIYTPSYESALAYERAEELFNAHWEKVRVAKELPNNARDNYLMTILMDMALNGSSPSRFGVNDLMFLGQRIAPTYMDDVGKQQLRQFARAYYPRFRATVLNEENHSLRQLLSQHWHCGEHFAVYCVDFVKMSEVPAAFVAFVLHVAKLRLTGSGSNLTNYIQGVSNVSGDGPPPIGDDSFASRGSRGNNAGVINTSPFY